MTLAEQIARCDREIAEIRARTDVAPAFLFVMGLNDWEMEKDLIISQSFQASR